MTHTASRFSLLAKAYSGVFTVALVAASLFTARAAEAATPQEVLVLINNQSATSRAIGVQYASKRAVPNVLRIECIDSSQSQNNETIPYSDYLSEIEVPLRAYLQSHPGINYIVTTRGIPIRIVGAPVGNKANGDTVTSLDSYLAALDYDKLAGSKKVTFSDPQGGAVGTAWENRYWNTNEPFSHLKFGGFLTTRLDGYSLSDAEGLTSRAIQSEAGFVKGAILLDVEPDFGITDPSTPPAPLPSTSVTDEDCYCTWNGDMVRASNLLSARNISVHLDVDEQFVGGLKNLQGYFSWGSNDSHFDQTAYNSLHFAPGAIGDTAVSTSARSFFPQSFGQTMIADLVHQGITGVKGYTDEPLLQGIASPSIALDHYTRGFTLAESFYAASRFVSWTDVVLGDPLAHPYAASEGSSSKP